MKVDMNLLKQLREQTKASFWECKKALVEAQGDLDQAKTILRERWMAKAAKKADRETNEWAVKVYFDGSRAYIVTLHCETDFVAKNEDFQMLVDSVYAILQKEESDVGSSDDLSEAIKAEIDALVSENILVLGENILLGTVSISTTKAYAYNHAGAKLASLVYYESWDEDLMKELALQVAAMAPTYYSFDEIPEDEVAKVKAAAVESLKDSWKPADIIEKIVEGKVKKELGESVLLEQSYIRDGSKKVKDIVGESKITGFTRLVLGA